MLAYDYWSGHLRPVNTNPIHYVEFRAGGDLK
jgi:hypothetical protein